jgi:hypothetical protein
MSFVACDSNTKDKSNNQTTYANGNIQVIILNDSNIAFNLHNMSFPKWFVGKLSQNENDWYFKERIVLSLMGDSARYYRYDREGNAEKVSLKYNQISNLDSVKESIRICNELRVNAVNFSNEIPPAEALKISTYAKDYYTSNFLGETNFKAVVIDYKEDGTLWVKLKFLPPVNDTIIRDDFGIVLGFDSTSKSGFSILTTSEMVN